METFSTLLALYAGNSPVLVNSLHKGQWRGALMFSLIMLICGWVNNREAGDLIRNHAHYDVNVMVMGCCQFRTESLSKVIEACHWIPMNWTIFIGSRAFKCLHTQGHDLEVMFCHVTVSAVKMELGEVIYHGALSLSWWSHQMEAFSVLLALCAGNSPVTGEFPSQRPVTRHFDVFFDLRLNKRLSKQLRCRRFETPSCSLWRHCNGEQEVMPNKNKKPTTVKSRI